MKNRRKLVGRRYEDFCRHGIQIELSAAERLIRMIFLDPRYRNQLNRRHHVRRQSDLPQTRPGTLFIPSCGFWFSSRLKK